MSKSRIVFYGYLVILVAIISWAIYNWSRILAEGPGVTGASDMVPWGIFTTGLIFFIGASAGATIVGLMIHGFGRDDYKPIGTRALLIGILSLFAAVMFVLVDVGLPLRAMLIPWALRSVTSMFFISSTSYYVFMAMLLAELYFAIKVTRGRASNRERAIAKWLGIAAVPLALWVVHAFTGSIFGVLIAREFWNSPLMPVHFVSSALATGIALVLLVTILTSGLSKKELVMRETLVHMGKLLALFLTVTLFLDFFDLLILRYGTTSEGIEAWNILLGRYSSILAINLGGMLVALLLLLSKWGRTTKGIFVASSFALLGIVAYRIYLIIVGQLVPMFRGLGELSYSPTGTEISVFVGIVALGMLLYAILTRVIPMEEIA